MITIPIYNENNIDSVPVEGSDKLITSDGVFQGIKNASGLSVDIDDSPVNDSKNLVYSGGVFDADNTISTNLEVHKQTDAFRWNDVYQFEYNTLVKEGSIDGYKLDGTNKQEFSTTYTVSDTYGGIFQASLFKASEDVSANININGVSVYNTDGLPAGPTIIKSFIVSEGDVITITNPDQNFYIPFVIDTDSTVYKIMQSILSGDAANAANLTTHIESDEDRWQSTLDAQVAMEARLKKWCQDLILGSTPVLDYGNPTLVMGNGGLVNLLDGQEWTAPFNGSIVCASGGLLSVAYSVLVNGTVVWESPLYILGLKAGGDDSPSEEIPVNAGDVVTASGVLSLGSPINVTFYSNKA